MLRGPKLSAADDQNVQLLSLLVPCSCAQFLLRQDGEHPLRAEFTMQRTVRLSFLNFYGTVMTVCGHLSSPVPSVLFLMSAAV